LVKKPERPQKLDWMNCPAPPGKKNFDSRLRNPVWLTPVCQHRQQKIHDTEVTNRTSYYSVTSWKGKGKEISSISHMVRQSINIHF
jgi:hypothetical protein